MENRSETLNTTGYKYLSEKNYVAAFKYFAESARLGNSNGTYNLGYCYFHGFGTQKNFREAYYYLSQIAKSDSSMAVSASYLCGLMLNAGGFGIEQDMPKAKNYFAFSAEQGHAWSMFMLGTQFLHFNQKDTAKKLYQMAYDSAKNDAELQKQCKAMLLLTKI